MLNTLRIAAAVAFLSLIPNANAADVSGTWKGSFDFQGASVPVVIHLTSAPDGAVAGTVEGLPTSPTEIHDGKIDADAVTFWVNTDYQGTSYKLVWKGKVAAGEIDFSLGTEDGSFGTTLIAKNDVPGTAPAAPLPTLSGTWKGTFDFQGTGVPVTYHFAAAGPALTGTIEGLPTSPVEIHDGKIDGDIVTFWINTDYQGTTYKIVYKGKISADGIKFSFGTEDGSWGAEMTVSKA
jgi:hypothetical protein